MCDMFSAVQSMIQNKAAGHAAFRCMRAARTPCSVHHFQNLIRARWVLGLLTCFHLNCDGHRLRLGTPAVCQDDTAVARAMSVGG
jgi:hypothetical protein